MSDEPGLISTRTDSASYADRAMDTLQGIIGRLSVRRRGYIRDELAEAFSSGEQQGEFRALWILVVAQKHARGSEAQTLLRRCIALLAPDIEGWEIDEGVL